MKLEAITLKEERELFSLNENEPMEYGCIGHLRGDFGGSGKEYYSTWFDHTCKHLNDAKCKAIGNAIINTLNSDGNVMSSRSDMYNFCHPREDCKIDGIYENMTWGFRIFTEDYAFYLKCTPVCSDYNFYLYVYDKNMLLDTSLKSSVGLFSSKQSFLCSYNARIIIRCSKSFTSITLFSHITYPPFPHHFWWLPLPLSLSPFQRSHALRSTHLLRLDGIYQALS